MGQVIGWFDVPSSRGCWWLWWQKSSRSRVALMLLCAQHYWTYPPLLQALLWSLSNGGKYLLLFACMGPFVTVTGIVVGGIANSMPWKQMSHKERLRKLTRRLSHVYEGSDNVLHLWQGRLHTKEGNGNAVGIHELCVLWHLWSGLLVWLHTCDKGRNEYRKYPCAYSYDHWNNESLNNQFQFKPCSCNTCSK